MSNMIVVKLKVGIIFFFVKKRLCLKLGRTIFLEEQEQEEQEQEEQGGGALLLRPSSQHFV